MNIWLCLSVGLRLQHVYYDLFLFILLFKMLWFWFLPKNLKYFSFGSEAAAILQTTELFLNKQFEISPGD